MNALGHLASFLIGVTMAVGFALAGVTRPETIVGFLDFAGAWEPAVMLVMAAAAAVTFVLYRLSFRRPAPLLAPKFMVPTRRDIDARLVVGSGLFGIGWGITGLCPGPALASVAAGSLSVYVFLAAMVAGMLLFRGYERALPRLRRRRSRQTASARRPVLEQQS